MALHTCPAGHKSIFRGCPICRAQGHVFRGRVKRKPVQLSPEKRIQARIVAERLKAKARQEVQAMAASSTNEIIRAMGQRQP